MANEAQVSVQLPEEHLALLREMAKESDRSVGAQVRLAIKAQVERWREGKQ